MKNFWTCGPFKEANDNLAKMIFKAEQMKVFMETLEEAKAIDKIIKNGTKEEQLLASMMKLDVDKKLDILLGIPDGRHEEENDEISREALLESIEGSPEK